MSPTTKTAMDLPEMEKNGFDTEEWTKRKRDNKRLGYVFGIIVLAIFLGSIWKYRPF
jgi:hypothetical protein